MPLIHRLLLRQIKRHLGADSENELPENLQKFLAVIDEAYSQYDADRKLSERSLELASVELVERNAELELTKSHLEQRVIERTTELRDANAQLLVDIAHRQAAEKKLRESEERYELVVRGANDGIWDWDLLANSVYFSPRWKSMLGLTENDLTAKSEDWFNRIHDDDRRTVEMAIASHLEGFTSHVEIEHRIRHHDGGYRWMLCRGAAQRDQAGKAYRIAGSHSDITNRKDAEEQLLRAAFNDSLTSLPNRALFTDRLERAILRTRRSNYKFSVLFLDLDRFKVVNDSLGHVAGDQLLVAFAQRLSTCLRPVDTLGRLGGDEFTVLLEDVCGPESASQVADRILEALKAPFNVAGHEVFTSASIGIAHSDGEYERPQDMLRDADTAMYRAKAQGKARAQLFDSAMHARAVKLLQIENDLRRAVERNELIVHYQPIMPLDGTEISGFEALVRWRHPERGLIPPSDFIPVAEETGVILEIGKYVLQAACKQMHAWHQTLPSDKRPFISVNLSARQFGQLDLVEQITSVLNEVGLDPKYLVLEITESIIVEHPDTAARMLGRLKTMGVKIDIDDFGTGYSSLGYLQRFPADTMKIDRSFVTAMFQNPENAEIINTIISLAHSLNMTVTAEGIETIQQLEALRALGCEHAQGYYFSKPVDPDAAGNLLHNSFAQTGARVA